MLKSKLAEFSAKVVCKKELNSIIGGEDSEMGFCNIDGSVTLLLGDTWVTFYHRKHITY